MTTTKGNAPRLAGGRGVKNTKLADFAAYCADNSVENQRCPICSENMPAGSGYHGCVSIKISLENVKATIIADVCAACALIAKNEPVRSVKILTQAARGVLGMGPKS